MADPIDIEEARRLCDGATPAPWRYGALEFGGRCLMDAGGYVFAQIDDDGNGRFAAGARSTLPAALDEIEQLRAKLDRWRNCFICLECGRGSVDEDGCCATCGRDSLQIVDGKIADTSIAARIDALDDNDQKLRAELAEAHEALTAARSEVTERYFVTFSLGSHRRLLGPHHWNDAQAVQVEALDIDGACDIRIESVEEVLRG